MKHMSVVPKLARVSVVTAIIALLAFSMSGCPGGLPSLVGLWSLSFGARTIGVQFSSDGSVEGVDIGTGTPPSNFTTWSSFSTAGIEFRQLISGRPSVLWVGTLNADSTMNGRAAFSVATDELQILEWSATKL